MIAALAVSTVVSLLSWHLYENQFLKLKRLFEYREPSVAPLPLHVTEPKSDQRRIPVESAA
jgi:hypothetical protein